ncbi:MAG: VWA domain-containing protein [Acidobacteriota bacterium]|nr:VWA domain-containing protein [Acidobacteriota bacterium]
MVRINPMQMAIPALFLLAAAASAPAQSAGAQGGTQTTDAPEIGEPIRTSVTNIVAPVLVTDRSGNIIDGLQPNQFHLFDNNKEQNIQVDVSFEPVSVVLAIEASVRMDAILKQIRHLGTLMPLVVGEHGEAAVMAFDSRLRVMQEFTNDSDRVKAAIDKITAGNSSSRMIDAVEKGVFMLRNRPKDNRKIILLVSETRDMASEGRLREALIDAQLSNVFIYTVDVTQLAVRLTEKPTAPRPDAIDVTARPGVWGKPSTPTTAAQGYGPQNEVQFAPLLAEIYRDTKRIFVENPSTVFSKGTGGAEFSFVKQHGLEEALQRISQEIRSQYLITYSPNNKEEPGFHAIAVTVDKTNYVTKTRPGYWLGGGKGQ